MLLGNPQSLANRNECSLLTVKRLSRTIAMRVDVRWLPAYTHATIPERTYNKDHSFLVTVATLVSIVLLIFLLRVYTRTRLLRFFGIDDCLMLGAVVS
jgi:hypothetical protein